jgi:hypothetical protein
MEGQQKNLLHFGRQLQRLFFVPKLKKCVARLPMGWCRAPDIASAVKDKAQRIDHLALRVFCI